MLTEEQYERVEKIVAKAISHEPTVLSEWELDFINSTADRMEKYEERTNFSDKQMQVLDKIEKKLEKEGIL